MPTMEQPGLLQPTDAMLDDAAVAVSIGAVNFCGDLERLRKQDFLPRYNRIELEILFRVEYLHELLLLTVRRRGSSIGEDNFYTYPMPASGFAVDRRYRVEFLHFDAFNLPFERIGVTPTTRGEYEQRQLNLNAVRRAAEQVICVTPVEQHN